MALIGVGHNASGFKKAWASPDEPSHTIQTAPYFGDAGGIGYLLEDDQPERPRPVSTNKPPYRVPTMAEIRDLPWNGYTAISTFSGCGGSSLGYRMAGFRVLWASEFVEAARDSYLANAAPYTKVDGRDIRRVSAAEILEATGLQAGQLDLFDGSPPCAAFSTAGKREAGWGKVKKYSDTKQRVDDLFFEYTRLLRDLQPKVFVAENVSGLVKGTAKGYFIAIMRELKSCGYRVGAKVLDAQWLGVPQSRQRLIIVGVRNDLRMDPRFPGPLPYRYSVREALPWIAAQGDNGGFGGGAFREATVPSGTIGASPNTGNGNFPPSAVIDDVRFVHDTGGQPQYSGGDITNRPAPTVLTSSRHFRVHEPSIIIRDRDTGHATRGINTPAPVVMAHGIGGVASHQSGLTHITGDPVWTPDGRALDPETGFELSLKRHAIGKTGKRVRRFTIAELRAICSFPSDFILTGTYEQRWERLGRAVPPVMMRHIAATIRDNILKKVNQ